MPTRILVLGSRPSTRAVTSFGWEELPGGLNIADYEKVIFDLAPIVADHSVAERVDQDALPKPAQVMRLLNSPDGELVVMGGTPGTPLWGEWHGSGSSIIPMESLFPSLPQFEINERGEHIVDVDADFSWYLEQVTRWTWWAEPEEFVSGQGHMVSEYLREAGRDAGTVRPFVTPLARTRFGKCVAFKLFYAATRPSPGYGGRDSNPMTDLVSDFGPVIWLPLATRISPKEAVELVLARMMNVGGIVQTPDWAERYVLSEEERAASLLDSLRDQARELGEKIHLAGERLDHERRFKKLLYEQGDELEQAVWDTLETLGATVSRPAAGVNEEDGRFEDPYGRVAMLEIKGRGGSAKLQDVRQLHDWMENAYHEGGWEGKGVLVANAYLAEDPGSRGATFPDNCVRAARRYGICLITSHQLFDEIRAAQKDEADLERFWESVFETDGELSLGS